MKRLHLSAALRPFLIASVCCGLVISGATIACAVLVAHVVAGLITDPLSRTIPQWWVPLSMLLGLWSIRVLGQWLQARLSQRGATAVIASLNRELLTTVTALTPRKLAARRDDATALVTHGLDGLRPYLTRYLPAVILAGFMTPAAIAVMACYDLQATAIVLVALPLVPLFMVLIGMVTAERSAASLKAMATLQSRLLDLIAGIPTLRALGRAEGPAHRVAELAAAHRRSAIATLRITFLSSLVLELLATLGVALVAVSVGLRLVNGEMTLSAALTVLLLAPEVFWPLRRIGAEFHAAQDGRTAAGQAFDMLDRATPTRRGTTAVTDTSIRIEDLSVASREGFSPHELSATIEPGAVTVLTGPNGAGKSTALEAVLGLTQPTSGRVLVGGVDVHDVDLTDWWRHVAWLPQRPALIPGTVRDNLELFGALTDLKGSCRTAGFDSVLADLPDGLHTTIGRGGTGLSLGQRQRLGLARVLGSTKPVLLLDEPTAHLQADLEARVLQAIAARAREGATVLMVGHRQPVLAVADRIIHVTRVGGEVLVRR